MKITLAQINTVVGDIEGNTKKIISIIKNAKSDIVVFPELSIIGYSPQDLLLKKSFIEKNLEALEGIALQTRNKAAIVGFIQKKYNGLYNSAVVINDRKIIKIHNKICLPNYTIFDEKRWFKEGNEATVFELHKKKIGLSICEDIWFPETTKAQGKKGAELIINISASPYRKGKLETIENVLKQRWIENRLPIAYINLVGAQDGIVYYGHSMFFDKGKIIAKCNDFEEGIKTIEIK